MRYKQTFTQGNPTHEQWFSLISSKSQTKGVDLRNIFNKYIESLKGEKNADESIKLRCFRKILKDEYMEYIITSDINSATTVRQISKILGENPESLFKSVDEVFKNNFNENWKYGLYYAMLAPMKEGSQLDHSQDCFIQENYNEMESFGDIEDNKLLAYRIANPTLLYSFNTTQRSLELITNKEPQNNTVSNFSKKLFYITALHENAQLRERFSDIMSLFYKIKNSSEELNYPIDTMIKGLVSPNKELSDGNLRLMDYVKESVCESYFEINFVNNQQNEQAPKLLLPSSENDDNYPQTFSNEVIEMGLKYPLPKNYLNKILPQKQINQIEKRLYSKDSQKMKEYLKLAKKLFDTTQTSDEFIALTSLLSLKICTTSKLISSKKEAFGIENAWRMLCNGNLNDEKILQLSDDIGLKCSQYIRQIRLSEINNKLKKFQDFHEEKLTPPGSPCLTSEYPSELAFKKTMVPNNKRFAKTFSSRALKTAVVNCNPPITSAQIKSKTAAEKKEDILSSSLLRLLFDNFTFNIANEIINTREKNAAKKLIKTFINFAKISLESTKPNCFAAAAIVAALDGVAISRLSWIFDDLSEKSKKDLKEIKEIFSSEGGLKNYRNYAKKSEYPIIPCFYQIETDLKLVTENSSCESQEDEAIKQCDYFTKSQYLLKIVNSSTIQQSDVVETIMNFNDNKIIQPPIKIECGVDDFFASGEWESLDTSEKLYYASAYYFQNPKRMAAQKAKTA